MLVGGHLEDRLARLSTRDACSNANAFDSRSPKLGEPMFTGFAKLLLDLLLSVGVGPRSDVRHRSDMAVHRVAPDMKQGHIRVECFGEITRCLEESRRDRG